MNALETKTALKSIQLVDGTFSTSQTLDIIRDLIDTKINYHKLSRLRLSVHNQNDEAPYDNKRLDELISEKKRLLEIIESVKNSNKKIKVTSLINLEYID